MLTSNWILCQRATMCSQSCRPIYNNNKSNWSVFNSVSAKRNLFGFIAVIILDRGHIHLHQIPSILRLFFKLSLRQRNQIWLTFANTIIGRYFCFPLMQTTNVNRSFYCCQTMSVCFGVTYGEIAVLLFNGNNKPLRMT